MAVRCVETFVSCGTCDIVAQTLIENHGWSDLDLTRSFKFAAIGFCWTGPMMTLWYPRYLLLWHRLVVLNLWLVKKIFSIPG